MVVILKVGGLTAAADCIRAAIARDSKPWKLVHVSTLNQARLALARERVDVVLLHHQLPDGDALTTELPLGDALRVVSIDPGCEAVAAQALDMGFADYVVEASHEGFGAVMVAQLGSVIRMRETTRTLHRQHGVLSAISRAQASFIQTTDNRTAFNFLLADLLALTHSAFGFVGEVFYDAPDAPWLQVHAITNLAWDEDSRVAYADVNGPGMAFRNLNTLFGAALVTGEPVLSNSPAADPRAGGVPRGHPPLHAFMGIPVGPPGQLLALVGLANRPGGYAPQLLDHLRPLLDTLGQMVAARRLDAQRRETAHVLQTTLNSIEQGLLMTDARGICTVYNQRVLALLDLPEDLLASRPSHRAVFDFQIRRNDFGPDFEWIDDPAVRAFMANPDEPSVLPATYRRRTRDGRVLEVQRWNLPGGEIMRTYADVTAAANSQQALVAAKERLSAIIDATRAGTWEWYLDTDEVVLNERYASLVGYTVDELPRQVTPLYAVLLHPADEARLNHASQQHLEGVVDHFECQFRFRHKAGHWVWLMERGRVQTRHPDGRPLMMAGTTIDITDSKHAEDALRVTTELLKERTQALETTLHAMSQGLMVVGPDGRVRLYNEQLCHILEFSDSYLSTMPTMTDLTRRQMQRGDFGPGLSLVHGEAREYVLSGAAAVDESVPRRYLRRTRMGHYLDVKSDPLPGGGFVRTFTDVTSFVEAVDTARQRGEEVRQLNESLEQRVALRTRELERAMQDVEALSYSIAHDLRGPLRAVNGFAALIAADEADRLSPDGRELFGRITEASRRMGVMITDLLELFKVVRAEIVPVTVDLAALAQDAVRSLVAAYPRTQVDIAPMPTTQGDASLLRLLMFNLIDNALKYSSKADQPCISVGWSSALQAWFVRDNGVGFDMARADKLFGLFQRMHAPSDFDGTGVGLAVVARVVERHGGRVWAEARPGQGATLWFSLNGEAAPSSPAPQPRAASVALPGHLAQPGLFDG
ncbi:MAG TPA: PAS-domain containing protein [Burkholderiaceae bacterium]|nr:PAS-domain containing protein [Burkholderiaceae bacterium]